MVVYKLGIVGEMTVDAFYEKASDAINGFRAIKEQALSGNLDTDVNDTLLEAIKGLDFSCLNMKLCQKDDTVLLVLT